MAQKSYQTSLQAYIANVNDVEECRFWSQDVNETDQYLAARPDPLMSNIVCVVCPRGVFFLGVLGASWAYLVFDLHG